MNLKLLKLNVKKTELSDAHPFQSLFGSCCRLFAVLQDSLFNSQCLSILQFKLISIHASKSARLFHFYISRKNSVIYRMIR